MRSSVVRAKLSRNEPVAGVALHFTDPSVYELTSLMGFDFIWMDMEHHAYSVETANGLMRAARVGKSDIMCRPAKGEFMRMGRMLEAGAHGILYPRCDSAEEAREVVRWAKFAPLGTRGFDGGNPDMPYCQMDMAQYLKKSNDETWIVIQIEDPQALEQVDEIAAVEGVDVIMLGPADFSILSGIPGQFQHAKIQEALLKIKAACDRHGKHWGTIAGTPERIKQLIDMGAHWTTCGCDLLWTMNGLKQAQRDLAPMGFKFENQFAPSPGSPVIP
jgi:4-hydroxy-2-oxoheptanedioate aldolase